MCPDNPDEYRRAKGIYEKISGWNEQTETETGTGKTGCQNRKSTGNSHVKPPLYLVFFKSKDVDVMTAAFKEYAGAELDQSKKKKPSVRKKLQKTQERKAKHRQRVKTKQKVRGQER